MDEDLLTDYHKRRSDEIIDKVLEKLEANDKILKKIEICLLGDYDKQGLVSKVQELDKTQKDHISSHWKFTGIIISLATLFSSLFSKLWGHK